MTLKGVTGKAQIAKMMDDIRQNPPKAFGAFAVEEFRDYKENVVKKADGSVAETGLPASNVLYFELSNDAWCCMRPSGTEPKIKFYMGVKGTSLENASKLLEDLTKEVLQAVGE